jgi:hypothetical protein
MNGTVPEMDGYGLEHIGAKFVPGLPLCKDSMAKSACEIAAFFSVANFED